NLVSRTKELGLEQKIIFTGIVPHSEAPQYLSACDILVSPHLGFETNQRFFGSPTKLFEYMAMGKAIVASDLEQIGKVIIDGINGLKVNPGNVDELAEKILSLAGDKTLQKKLGENARNDVIKNYTWEMNAKRVLNKMNYGLTISLD
ncbi:MAG: glycosyltransferase family 4 protein, partial [Ignavibacteria bacterium]|nr:glycosyltransferase family 4 protein [Ignavibacteria bacterium]